MPDLAEVRQQFPQYGDMTDGALADALHTKFYSDMPRADFDAKLGLSKPAAPVAEEPQGDNVPGQISLPGIGKPSLIGMAKGIWSGLTLPGDVYAGKVDPLSEEGIQRSANLAGTVALGSTAAPAGALGTGMVRPKAAISAAERVTPEEVMAAGAAGKKEAQNSLVAVDPKLVENYVTRARTELANDSKPRSLAGGVHDALSELEASAKAAREAGQPLSASDMVGFRGTLTEFTKTPSNNSAAAGLAKSVFDKWAETALPTLAPEIKNYVSNFRVGYLGQDIANKTNRATFGAAAANSGMNIENRLRQSLVGILSDPRKLNRYSSETQGLMKQAVEGTITQNGLRKLGNILGGGGGLLAAMYGLGGFMAHPGLAVAPIAGWGVKTLGNKMQLSKLDKIAQSALSNSPYAIQKQMTAAASLPPPQLTGGILGLLARNPQGLLPMLSNPPIANSSQ